VIEESRSVDTLRSIRRCRGRLPERDIPGDTILLRNFSQGSRALVRRTMAYVSAQLVAWAGVGETLGFGSDVVAI
jgi:hypothetical protein